MLDRDLFCRSCGYNLRGLKEDGTCPECATPVARTLEVDWLRHADEAWLRQVQRGARWAGKGLTVAGFIGACMLFLCALPLQLLRTLTNQAPWVDPLVFVLLIPISIIASLIIRALVGVWLFSRPEPREELERPLRAAVFRVLSVLMPPILLLWMAIGSPQSDPWNLPYPAAETIAGIFLIVWTVHSVLLNRTAASMEYRAAGLTKKMRKTRRFVTWMIPLVPFSSRSDHRT